MPDSSGEKFKGNTTNRSLGKAHVSIVENDSGPYMIVSLDEVPPEEVLEHLRQTVANTRIGILVPKAKSHA